MLTTACVLALSLMMSGEAGPAPDSAVSVVVQSAQPDEKPPEFVAMEAAGAAMAEILKRLGPQAALIRADATLDAATKAARITALLDPYDAEVKAFEQAIAGAVTLQMRSEGASAEQAAGSAEMMRQHLMAAMMETLIQGEGRVSDLPTNPGE